MRAGGDRSAPGAQEIHDRNGTGGVDRDDRGRPPRLGTPNARSRTLRKVDQRRRLQSCLHGAREQHRPAESRVQVAPAALVHAGNVGRSDVSDMRCSTVAWTATLPLSRPDLRLLPVSGVAVTSSACVPRPSRRRAALSTVNVTFALRPALTVIVRVAIVTCLPPIVARARTRTRSARLSALRTRTTRRPFESTVMVGWPESFVLPETMDTGPAGPCGPAGP